uniref:Uncharacterized protein n=1 Tax=Rhizophora mucronata TaxID=61149 RepID=A0A2P2KRI2_RHIMU
MDLYVSSSNTVDKKSILVHEAPIMWGVQCVYNNPYFHKEAI